MANELSPFLMEPGCPWVDLRHSSGVPDIVWCEKQLCSWIATPVNTWSNLAYLIAAAGLFWVARHEKSKNLHFYGTAAVWVGLCSFIYHASLTFATQVLDFFGMFLFLYLVLGQNLARMDVFADRQVKRFVWGASIATTLLSSVGAKLGMRLQPVVMLLILTILLTELFAANRATRRTEYRYFALSLIFLGVGAIFSASDVTRRFCMPESLIQGHALWHVLGAFSLYFSLLHYRQFYSKETGVLEV